MNWEFATILPVFFRVSGCIMLVPGIGSVRIPSRIKLYIALFVAVAIAPSIIMKIDENDLNKLLSNIFVLCVHEFGIGVVFGLFIRLIVSAIETAGVVISHAIGLSNSLGTLNDDMDQMPVIATLLGLSMTVLIFLTDLHLMFLMELYRTYEVLALGSMLDVRNRLSSIVDATTTSFVFAIRISAPFLVVMFVSNLAIALISRLVQQVPIYFVSLPMMIGIGLFLLMMMSGPILEHTLRSIEGLIAE